MDFLIKDTISDKLKILTEAAKYDVACTSSGVDRKNGRDGMGNARKGGICHSFAGDGRCISLLKILLSNDCVYDCKYCANRVSNDIPRATFTPEEICSLTMEFYRRNYIEGLFLSSGVVKNPNITMGMIYTAVKLLREDHNFKGYIHVKAIPGADPGIIEATGYLVDRMSCNLELPTGEGLKKLAPHKTRKTILKPMRQIQDGISVSRNELMVYKHARHFVPAGQSTQMIIGATPETDYQIINVAQSLYERFSLKRVFYSAYVAINEDKDLPMLLEGPPLLREHRLYQADWLLRFYGFKAKELLCEERPNFNTLLDPKCDWAVRNLGVFPVEVNKADYYTLLRVPGIGVNSAERICKARRFTALDFDDLKKIGVVLKRAVYFITCKGRMMYPVRFEENSITENLLCVKERLPKEVREAGNPFRQLSLFDDFHMTAPVLLEDYRMSATGQM